MGIKLIKKDQTWNNPTVGNYTPKLETATIDDVTNTESSFNRDEKIQLPYESKYVGLVNPFTGGYANLNIQKYENLKEGTEKYETPYFIQHGKKKDPNLEDIDSSYEFLYNWYTNPKRQAIKEQNDLEQLLLLRNAWDRRNQFYDSAISEKISNGDMTFIKNYKKNLNKAKRQLKSLNKQIEVYLTNPEKTAEKTKESLDSDLERVINLPISMYDPESMESSVYYSPNNWADINYIEGEDKEMYTPKVVEEYTDDGKKKSYKVTTNAYYSPNKNKTKKYLSFNKNKAFRSNDISSAGEEAEHAMELKSSEWIARSIVNDITKYQPDYIFDAYYDSPEEIVGKLGNLRRELNVDPNKEWSLEEIKEIKKNYKGRNHILKNYPPEIILQLFNRIAKSDLTPQTILNDVYYAKKGKKLIKKCQYGTPRGGLVYHQSSGSWGDRGQGNELQSALENGLTGMWNGVKWIGDKVFNAGDYIENGLIRLTGIF